MRAIVLPLTLACAALALAACDDDGATGVTTDTVGDDADATSAADADTDDVTAPLAFCDGPTRFAWAPEAGRFDGYPDDYWTVADPLTRTGRRLSIPDTTPFLANVPVLFAGAYSDLNALDGWGTNAGIVLSFDALLSPAPSGAEASMSSDALMLWALPDDGPAYRVPFEARYVDESQTVIVEPMIPLAPKTPHGLLATTAWTDDAGGCMRPSDALISVLEGTATDARLVALEGHWDALIAAAGVARDDVSAGLVFTTQSTWDAGLEARDDIETLTLDWKQAPACNAPGGGLVRCKGVFTARDYRVEGDLGGALPDASYNLPVTIWLPADADGALPVLMFGHGLGGSVTQAGGVAASAASSGLATIAISAPRHGDHPTRRPNDPNAPVLDFFGVNVASFTFESFQFRENMRQAVFDKLQVLALLQAHPDVDGDDAPDLDMDQVVYWGASLGAIMGADLLALSADVDAAVLTVGGARMGTFITDSQAFGQFRAILAELFGGESAFLKAIPIAQTLIDAGDPATLARHVVRDRLIPGEAPHVLAQMVIGDEVVPNSTTRHLARALGLTHLAPVIQPVDGLPVADDAPLSANVDGETTAGLFQFDRVRTGVGGAVRVADHNNIFQGIEGLAQVFGFIDTWLTGTPLIADPYADLATPALP